VTLRLYHSNIVLKRHCSEVTPNDHNLKNLL